MANDLRFRLVIGKFFHILHDGQCKCKDLVQWSNPCRNAKVKHICFKRITCDNHIAGGFILAMANPHRDKGYRIAACSEAEEVVSVSFSLETAFARASINSHLKSKFGNFLTHILERFANIVNLVGVEAIS